MKLKKLESGRSMVEILGVLAIIGVLSVGGIAGYTLSMRKHRANGIADLASKYALAAYAQCHKKFQDDEAYVSTSGITCQEDMLTFENAGIGNLPAGVKKIELGKVVLDSQSGGDTVDVYIYFNDQKLCQAMAVTTNSSCSPDTDAVMMHINQN